jgi:dihydrofolate synthase/folylpolyglutamate synthase
VEHEKYLHQNITTELYGSFQLKNLATAWYAARMLQQHDFRLEETAMLHGIAQVRTLTNLIGRWQFLKNNGPTIVCDSGHNEHGLKVALPGLLEIKHDTLHMVIGFVNDKDLSKVLPLFPAKGKYYFCKPDIPRGLDADETRRQALPFGLKGESFASVKEAFDAAVARAKKDDLIFVGGSTFVVAEVL